MLLFEPIFNNFQAKALLFFSLFIKSSTITKIQAYLVKKGARFKQAIRIHLVHHAINHPYMSQCLFIIQPGLVHWWHVGGGRRAHVTLATGDRIGNDQRKHSLVHMASLLFWQNWQGVFLHCCSLAGKWDSQIMQVSVLRLCIALEESPPATGLPVLHNPTHLQIVCLGDFLLFWKKGSRVHL